MKRIRASALIEGALANGDVKLKRPGDAELCTFTADAGATEDFPVTCVRKVFAQKWCESEGGRLPTETEFAYVASGRVGAAFVWGNDAPSCGDAIFGRNPDPQRQAARICLGGDSGVGAAKVATGARDVLVLRTGRIFDLSGSVAEWMFDDYVPPDDPCRAALLSIDPVCTASPSVPAFRGGAWNMPGLGLRAVDRGKLDAVGPDLGFRCARPATAK